MKCEIVDNWSEYYDLFSERNIDIYYTKEYISLYENNDKKAKCIICSDNDKIIIMPYLQGCFGDCYDFETAYGYGGPISNTEDDEWNKRALLLIFDKFKEEKYICGFTRFHPLIGNEALAGLVQDDNNSVFFDRKTVVIDTSDSIDDIWNNQISSKNRNTIRKAENNNLRFKAEYDYASYNEFIDLYRKTMDRLSADKFYYFDDRYFDEFRERFYGHSFLGTIRKDEKLVCAAIFMYSQKFGHYHLEGSDDNYSKLGANNLLLWKTACEMHDLGIDRFHLGGGVSADEEDSLYKFKKAFSRINANYFIGKAIFNQEIYNKLCSDWEMDNPEKIELYGNRLLKYRY